MSILIYHACLYPFRMFCICSNQKKELKIEYVIFDFRDNEIRLVMTTIGYNIEKKKFKIMKQETV
jgi:hypothetical protein